MNRFYRTYLPLKFHIWFWVVSLFLLLFLSGAIFFVFLLVHVLLILTFRKFKHFFKEDQFKKDEVLFSPVNGKVTSIRKNINHDLFGSNLSEVRIVIPWWKEYGIFLPKTAEIKDLVHKPGKAQFRYSWPEFLTFGDKMPAGLYLELETIQDGVLGLHFSNCPLGMSPQIYVLPGDRAKSIANIGYFPFGGTLHFYFPENFEILVQQGQSVQSGDTLIAGTIENR